jgi:hypothetical protein
MKATPKKGVPRELFAASITPASVDAGNRAVDVVFGNFAVSVRD